LALYLFEGIAATPYPTVRPPGIFDLVNVAVRRLDLKFGPLGSIRVEDAKARRPGGLPPGAIRALRYRAPALWCDDGRQPS
jgi:hypothetical protein